MKIHDDHLYHGAALIQIAEDERFTAINSMKVGKTIIRVAYRINDDIGVYLKYATKPTGKNYVFTFNEEHLSQIDRIQNNNAKCMIAMVCVAAREICVISHAQLADLLKRREKALGHAEETLSVLVTIETGKSFRVWVNEPGRKGVPIGKQLVVSRNEFPEGVFS
jgi:hypothetical protein